MKLICYSLFNNSSKERFESKAYIRGAFWNSRMNSLIYPEWRTHIELQLEVYSEYNELFDWLIQNNNLSVHIVDESNPALCAAMLWRMKPAFDNTVTHILCRDSDAITTYREAQRVQEWLESGKGVHSILDNPAHSGLMGGMVGFDTAKLKAATSWRTWEEMIEGADLKCHGSDQHLLNKRILPHMETETHTNGMTELTNRLPNVDAKLWESNLTCRHIGSAGVVELELLRFFKRFDPYNWKFAAIEQKYPHLFYWHL